MIWKNIVKNKKKKNIIFFIKNIITFFTKLKIRNVEDYWLLQRLPRSNARRKLDHFEICQKSCRN